MSSGMGSESKTLTYFQLALCFVIALKGVSDSLGLPCPLLLFLLTMTDLYSFSLNSCGLTVLFKMNP